MELIRKSCILQRNDNAYPITTEFVNRFGNKVILPAHCILFCDQKDSDGNPIYEFVKVGYFTELEEVLIASEVLEKKIEERDNRKQSILEKQPRVLSIVLFLRDRVTGEIYFVDEEQLKSAIDTWANTTALIAMIFHDADAYMEKDEREHISQLRKNYFSLYGSNEEGLEDYIQENQSIFEGNQKPPHYHIVIGGTRGKSGKRKPIRMSTICNRLHIRPCCIKIIKDNTENGGTDGFLDQICYLPHETETAQDEGKTLYPRNRVYSNFDWEQALADRDIENAKYGKDSPTLLQKWMHDVLLEGKTLKECKLEDWELYSKNKKMLWDLREEYLRDTAPTPPVRLSYYIEAKNPQGGEGKTQCAKCFARTIAHDEYGASMYEPFESLSDYIYFIADPKVSMQHYDGQPIVIFNDFKAGDLLTAFKSRDALKNFLEPHPEKIQCDIKYGDTTLIPKYVIINGIQTYEEFIDKLASTKNGDDSEESRQKQQFDRRFFGRIIIDSTQEAVKLLVNRDYLEDTPERQGYLEIKNVFRRLVEQFDANSEKKVAIEQKTFQPMIEYAKIYTELQSSKSNEVTAEFVDYGEEVVEWTKYPTATMVLTMLEKRGYKKGPILYTLDDDIGEEGFHILYRCREKEMIPFLRFSGEWSLPYWFDKKKKLIYPIQEGYPSYEDCLSEEEYEDLVLQASEIEEDFFR